MNAVRLATLPIIKTAQYYGSGMRIKTTFSLAMVFLFAQAFAQKEIIKNWHLLDAQHDGYHGISLYQAMDLLKNKTPQPIIVAVMDGGIDTNHPALRNCLWKNKKEISTNGIDDDHNGFVDDIHGWNFLGNANGQNVNHDSQEAVRLYRLWENRFGGKQLDSANCNAQTLSDFRIWKVCKNEMDVKEKEMVDLKWIQTFLRINLGFDSVIREEMKVPEYTADDLEHFVPTSKAGKKAKLDYLRSVDLIEMDHDKTNRQFFDEFESFIKQQKELQRGKLDSVENYRFNVTGDNENSLENTHYGNADIMGGTSLHGTHVSGIIAAQCSDTGTSGVAPFAKIMTVRCVPDGDEHDKDIALGIIYAVDNGAKVINMSFGKTTSPHQAWVDSAIQYAAAHDVLLVHAAGNESENIDNKVAFPSSLLLNNTYAPNFITVGASGDSSLNCGMVADFTNYGIKTVDVLAPGVRIYATLPNNSYGYETGTSMSAPIVAGLAALLRGYFPTLTAVQTKEIIEKSVDASMANQLFKMPGNKKEKIRMDQLCKTGGIINAYNAVLLAQKVVAAQIMATPIINPVVVPVQRANK